MGKYLTVEEVARFLGVHKKTVRKYIRQGKLSAVRSESDKRAYLIKDPIAKTMDVFTLKQVYLKLMQNEVRLLESKEEVDDFIRNFNIRNFKSEEFMCRCGCKRVLIANKLIVILQMLRDHLQKPVVITSAYRCPSWNKKVGGVSSSAHVFGLAVDIACVSSGDRYKIVRFLQSNGVERIGIAKNFIHFDIDEEKPKPVLFHYYYRKGKD